MKITRRPLGTTNVQELQAARNAAISPQEAAASQLVKYNAISDVAGAASKTLTIIAAADEKIKDSEDKVTESNLKNERTAQLAQAEREAKENNWSPEIFEDRVDSILKGYEAGLSRINLDRNRSFAQQAMSGENAVLKENAMAVSGSIRAGRATESWNQGTVAIFSEIQNTPPEKRDYRAWREHIQTGVEVGVITQAEGMEKLQMADDAEVGNELFIAYRDAFTQGGDAVAQFSQSIAEGNYTDEAVNAYEAEKGQFDKLMKGEIARRSQEESEKRAISMALFGDQITADTTVDEIMRFAAEMDVTNHGTIAAWLNKRKSAQNTTDVLSADWTDPADPAVKKAWTDVINDLTGENGEPLTREEKTTKGFKIAMDKGVSSTYIDKYFEDQARFGTVDEFIDSADRRRDLREKHPGIPIKNTTTSEIAYDYYSALTRDNAMDEERASRLVLAVRDMPPEEKTANETALNTPDANGDIPFERIEEGVNARIEQDEKLLVEMGFWDRDTIPELTPSQQAAIDSRVALEYIATGHEGAADEAGYQFYKTNFKPTSINDGVPISSFSGTTYGPQYMSHPPTHGDEATRAILAQDLRKGDLRLKQGGEWLDDISVGEIAFSDGVVKDGKMQWTLEKEGRILLNQHNQPARFVYPDPPEGEDTLDMQAIIRDIEKDAEKIRARKIEETVAAGKMVEVQEPNIKKPFGTKF